MALPVIFHKGGRGAVHQWEGVAGGLVPLYAIYAVSAVVVAGDDDVADELFGTFIVKVLLTFLEKQVPRKKEKKKRTKINTWPLLTKPYKRSAYFRSSNIYEHYRRGVALPHDSLWTLTVPEQIYQPNGLTGSVSCCTFDQCDIGEKTACSWWQCLDVCIFRNKN